VGWLFAMPNVHRMFISAKSGGGGAHPEMVDVK
jgi:hypothetical protein